MPSFLSTLYHKIPRYDFQLRNVTNDFDSNGTSYHEGVVFISSIQFLWLILALLLMAIVLPMRLFIRRKKYSPNIHESSCATRLMKLCCCLTFICLVLEITLLLLFIFKLKSSKSRVLINYGEPEAPAVVSHKPFVNFLRQLKRSLDERDIFSYYDRFSRSSDFSRDQIDTYLFERYGKKPIPVLHRNYVKNWYETGLRTIKRLKMEPMEPYHLDMRDDDYPVMAYVRCAVFIVLWIIIMLLIRCLFKRAPCSCPKKFGKKAVFALVLMSLKAFLLTFEGIEAADFCSRPEEDAGKALIRFDLINPPGRIDEGCVEWIKQHIDIISKMMDDYTSMFMETTSDLVGGSPYFWRKKAVEAEPKPIAPHEEFVAMDLYSRRFSETRKEIKDRTFWMGSDVRSLRDAMNMCPEVKPREIWAYTNPCVSDILLIVLTTQLIILLVASSILIVVLFKYIFTRNCIRGLKPTCGSTTCSQPKTGECDCIASDSSSDSKEIYGDCPAVQSKTSKRKKRTRESQTPCNPSVCSSQRVANCKFSDTSLLRKISKRTPNKVSRSLSFKEANSKSKKSPSSSTKCSSSSSSSTGSSTSMSGKRKAKSKSSSSCDKRSLSTIFKEVINTDDITKRCSFLKPCKGETPCSKWQDCPGPAQVDKERFSCSSKLSCELNVLCPNSNPCPGVVGLLKKPTVQKKSCSFSNPCSEMECPDLRPCPGPDKTESCSKDEPCPGLKEIRLRGSKRTKLYDKEQFLAKAFTVATPSSLSAASPYTRTPSTVTPSVLTPPKVKKWKSKDKFGFKPAQPGVRPSKLPAYLPKFLWNPINFGDQNQPRKEKKRTRTIYLKSPRNTDMENPVLIKIDDDDELMSPNRYMEACRRALNGLPVASNILTFPVKLRNSMGDRKT